MDFDGIEAQLLAVHDYGHVIVNAVADCDVKVFAVALYRAMQRAVTSPSAVRPHWSRPSAIFPTSRCSPGKRWSRRKQGRRHHRGGQPHQKDHCPAGRIEKKYRVSSLLRWTATRCWCRASWKRKQPHRGPLLTADRKGHHLLRVHKARGAHPAGRHPGSSPRAQRCHQRCTAKLRGRLTASPAFVVAKGGITSSDVGVKALRVKCAKVLGQIRPGIPVWQTGAESLFPGTPYIIFRAMWRSAHAAKRWKFYWAGGSDDLECLASLWAYSAENYFND